MNPPDKILDFIFLGLSAFLAGFLIVSAFTR